MQKRESLYAKYPDYRVDIEKNPRRVRVRFAGEVLADSADAVLVRESNHEPVIYFPRADVRLDRLERTDHRTFCPFKGDASYWTIRGGDTEAADAVWSYEAPFDEVVGLKNFIAFYKDRVDWV